MPSFQRARGQPGEKNPDPPNATAPLLRHKKDFLVLTKAILAKFAFN
jgi:hypothetical protein